MLQSTETLENGKADTLAGRHPYGLAPAKKKLRWLIENPPENGAVRLTINPAMAAAMMERNADDDWQNRPQSRRALDRYVRAMRKGWAYTGETIIFSMSGRLLNGQHRLIAALQANTSFDCLVVFDGVDDDAFKFMDVGTVRTAGHIFAIEGIPNYNAVASVCRVLMGYFSTRTWTGKDIEPENEELLEWYSNHPGVQDSIAPARQLYADRLLPVRWGGALHYICAQKSRAEADEFFERVASGIGLNNKKDPAFVLRRRLLQNATSNPADKLGQVYLAAYTIKAWNASRRNEDVGLLRWRGEQSPHQPFPRAV